MSGVELATAYVSIVAEASKLGPSVSKAAESAGRSGGQTLGDGLVRGADGKLRDAKGRFVAAGRESGKKYGDSFSDGGKESFANAGKESGQRFSEGFGGVIKGLALGGAGVAVGSFLKEAIAGASDLNESSTKINAIFGKAQGAVQAYASKGAKALGQTKLEVLDAAASFGTFGKAAGLQGPKLAKFSTGFAGLSTDLASFFNTDPSQAAEAIGAALRGEAEPIRQYGILLDDATLRNEALRLGLIKTTKTALTPQQKVLAAQAAIYKQTKDAQGDFQRTSGGLANQQRILKAQFSDMRTELGTKLLPVAVKVVTAASDLVTEFQNGTGAGGKIRDVLEDIVGVGKDVAKFFDHLPGGVKKFGAEGAIAILVFSKFSGVMGTATASLARFSGGAGAAAARTAALKTGMRNLAGAGGMLLLYQSTQQTTKKMGALEGAIGGALTGFAVSGNPFGALIGGVAGGLLGVATSGHKAANGLTDMAVAAAKAKQDADDLAASLDEVTTSYTKATRQLVAGKLRDAGAFEQGRALGLSFETVTNAALGVPRAVAKVQAALDLAVGSATKTGVTFDAMGHAILSTDPASLAAANAATSLAGSIDTVTDSTTAGRRKVLELAIATGEFKKSLKGVREGTILKIGTSDVDVARKALVNLVRRRKDLTDKQVQLLIKVGHLSDTVGDIRHLGHEADHAARPRTLRITPTLSPLAPKSFVSTISARAKGGPVAAGQPYIVGERRPELFVPNQSGRIMSHVPAMAATSAAAGLSGARLRLHIGGREIEGVLEQIADSRVDSAAAMAGQIERAFG